MAATRVYSDPDIGIPDLIHRLTDDSRRLVKDEVRLGKLEMADDMRRASRAGLWLAVAFGVGVVALTAFTLLFAALIDRVAPGHIWVGPAIVGVIEVPVGLLLIRAGMAKFGEPSFSLEQTRAGLEAIKG